MNPDDLRPGVYVRPRDPDGFRGKNGHVGVVTFSYFHSWGVARPHCVEVTWFDRDRRKLGNYSCRVRDLRPL